MPISAAERFQIDATGQQTRGSQTRDPPCFGGAFPERQIRQTYNSYLEHHSENPNERPQAGVQYLIFFIFSRKNKSTTTAVSPPTKPASQQ